jgi:hypothetical protein
MLSASGFFNDGDLFFRQAIQLVDQRIDLGIGGGDLALVERLVGGDGRGGDLFVQRRHALHQGDHVGLAGGVGCKRPWVALNF